MTEKNRNESVENKKDYKEIALRSVNGYIMLAVLLITFIASTVFIAEGHKYNDFWPFLVIGYLLMPVYIFMMFGFYTLVPNEAAVFMLFGKYKGTVRKEGFWWMNPFCSKFNPARGIGPRRNYISLKAMTLNNDKQKVNDLEGNPIEIGVVVIWKISDTAKAVFNVDNYVDFISIQSDAAIRNIARQYPYDIADEEGEKSLRGSSQEIAQVLCDDLQKRVEIAGIEVVEARISHLAYSQEIAAAMLQRQQAKAVVDARKTIVDGAVGMVELALEKLNVGGMVTLDEERKAQMVCNLMVVLCANKDAQPIVNSGSIN